VTASDSPYDAPPSTSGEVLERRYRLRELIGEGTFARVYEAVHLVLGHAVAVKILRSSAGESDRLRFQREAAAMAKLRSRHVPTVMDFGTSDQGEPFYVMERLYGGTLADHLERRPRLPPGVALAILEQIARAVKAGHRQGLIHRDLKPENIFLARGESPRLTVKVLDFGVARYLHEGRRLTRPGTPLGTLGYMPPEQAFDGAASPASDTYALAAMAFELLTGELPHPAESIAQFLGALRTGRPRTPSQLGLLAPGLDALFERALASDPSTRFQCPVAFVDALIQCVGTAATSLSSLSSLPPAPVTSHIRALRRRETEASGEGEEPASEVG
jgi:serine/threonine protein kinase